MAAPPSFPNPALHDIDDSKLALAYEEGHDADIPSNIGVYEGAEKSTAGPDLEKGSLPSSNGEAEEGTAAVEQDPNIVWWDEPADQDPENPMNWPEKKKWANIALLSAITFITPLASSMFAPAVEQVMIEFHTTSNLLATFMVSVYLLGFSLGPLVLAPMSEIWGRVPIYNFCNLFFIVFTIICAESRSMAMLLIFRFLAGTMGVATLTIGGGTIADLMPPAKRGGAMAIWAMGPLLGPVTGPVIGGFLAAAKGWRWVFWLLTILSGTFSLGCFFFMRETYAPTILERKAARLRKETGNKELRSKLATNLSPADLFKFSIVRPTKMLLFSPIVSLMSLYTAVTFGILYLLFTTITFVFREKYGFSTSIVGLTYVGSGVGMLIGLAVLGIGSDRIIKGIIARGEPLKPEHRLPNILTIPGGIGFAIGLLIYGWTTQYDVHWIVPLIGLSFNGFGMISVMMTIQTYLVDAFTLHAASAMAANAVLRSIFGSLLPLGGLDMYAALGLGWGNTLLAFLAIALIPVPVLFRVYGERIRARSQVNL